MEKERKSDEESMTMSDVSSNGGPEKSNVNNVDVKLPEEEGWKVIDVLLDNMIGGGDSG